MKKEKNEITETYQFYISIVNKGKTTYVWISAVVKGIDDKKKKMYFLTGYSCHELYFHSTLQGS